MKTDLVKGFRDYIGETALKRSFIRDLIRKTFMKYSFDEVETPIIEYEEFVKGDNQNDEAISDIFKLKDKGKRKLALRYEFTFQLKRISKNMKLPYKRFQIGPVFRDEPVSENRLRQFTQCDIDVVGSNVKNEAEILFITKEILNALKIKSVIYVNNRNLLNEILSDLGIKRKEEVLREIDKLDKLPESEVRESLKKLNAEKFLDLIQKKESFFEKFQGYSEINELKKYCEYYGITIVFSPFLTRGLSYYKGNVFEIKSEIKETICGGGTYEIGTNQATGISLGIERLCIVSKIKVEKNKILVISLKQDKEAIKIARDLRSQGANATVFYGKPSKALEYANCYGCNQVIFVGADEIKKKKVKIKDMKTGKETYAILEQKKKGNVLFKRRI